MTVPVIIVWCCCCCISKDTLRFMVR